MKSYYKISENGILMGGNIECDVDRGDNYWNVAYKGKIKIGKKVWGKFIGNVQEFAGSKRIPLQYLSEEFLKDNNSFKVENVTFTKMAEDLFTINVEGKNCNGKVLISRDGFDPVEINWIELTGTFLNYSLSGLITKC
jgi:hypothetical protein